MSFCDRANVQAQNVLLAKAGFVKRPFKALNTFICCDSHGIL